jgi:catechol 2,3-dioxygenase-like lactoylglutathione lyase family enzyme
VTRLHHVNVVVPPGGTEPGVAFYTEVLGFTRIPKAEGLRPDGAWLELPDHGVQLHLSERPGSIHPQAHFALVLDDFAAVCDRLAEREAEMTAAEDIFGGGRIFTRDPAGNRIELLERAGTLA